MMHDGAFLGDAAIARLEALTSECQPLARLWEQCQALDIETAELGRDANALALEFQGIISRANAARTAPAYFTRSQEFTAASQKGRSIKLRGEALAEKKRSLHGQMVRALIPALNSADGARYQFIAQAAKSCLGEELLRELREGCPNLDV